MKNSETAPQTSELDRGRLLAKLRANLVSEVSAKARSSIRATVRLSTKQGGIWFLENMRPGTALYNIATSFSINRFLDPSRVKDALGALMARHDALRSRVVLHDGAASLESVNDALIPIRYYDFRTYPEALALPETAAIVSTAAKAPFALEVAPLFRVNVIHSPCGKTTLATVFHHIVFDGWSLDIFVRELSQALSHSLPTNGAASYLTALEEDQSPVRTSDQERCLAYWKEQLSGPLPLLQLPSDRPRPTTLSALGRLARFEVDERLATRIRHTADAGKLSVFTVLLSAFKVFLYRMTQEGDVIVGTPFAGRDRWGSAGIIGFFANTVAIRTSLDHNLTFNEVLRRVDATKLDAQDNQGVSFEQVVSIVAPERSLRQHPIFQSFFGLYEADRDGINVDGASFVEEYVDTGTSKFDLSLLLTLKGSDLVGAMEYSTDLFDEATIRRYIATFKHVLEQLIDRPERSLKEVDLITPADRNVLSSAAFEDPRYQGLHYSALTGPFEEQVQRTPDNVALVEASTRLTYSELNARANRLAWALRSKGVTRDEFVGVYLERGIEMVIALYAIAKAGAAYVPLDPGLPDSRIAYMVEDSGARVIVTDQGLQENAAISLEGVAIVLADDPSLVHQPECNLESVGDSEIAYLLYTSGSTGQPKGVSFPVKASIAFLKWLADTFPVRKDDSVLFKTPFGFDVSVWEIFWPLYQGAKLIIAEPGGHRDPTYLRNVMVRDRINVVNFVPSMLQAFMDEVKGDTFPDLKYIFCAGEALSGGLSSRALMMFPGDLVNLYGPTETGAVTYHVVERERNEQSIPIGKPIPQAKVFILDDKGVPAPVGVVGELWVGGGLCLARDYHNQPELTEQRFLVGKAVPTAERLYRTGDFCRFKPDGDIEYIGRRDNQVKIRGVRIDLGEVEEALRHFHGVEECAVIPIEDGGSKTLVCFVRGDLASDLADASILAFLRTRVHPAAVPSAVRRLHSFPKTFNGKLDRKTLRELWERDRSPLPVPVRQEQSTISKLTFIFSDLLRTSGIASTDSFFDLGGHSLLVLKLAAACEREFGVRPSVADIFANPTAKKLATVLKAQDGETRGNPIWLSANSDLPVLVLFHAASGSALPYYGLVPLLGDVVAIAAFELDHNEASSKPFSTIQERAQSYLPLVQELTYGRPFFLGGWSFGGNIAFELTHLLLERGIVPTGTLLIDSWAPMSPMHVMPSEKDIEDAMTLILGGGESEEGPLKHDQDKIRRSLEITMAEFASYEPTIVTSPIYYLRATDDDGGDLASDPAYANRLSRWRSHSATLNIRDVGGGHFSLLRQEHISSTAFAIKDIIGALEG